MRVDFGAYLKREKVLEAVGKKGECKYMQKTIRGAEANETTPAWVQSANLTLCLSFLTVDRFSYNREEFYLLVGAL